MHTYVYLYLHIYNWITLLYRINTSQSTVVPSSSPIPALCSVFPPQAPKHSTDIQGGREGPEQTLTLEKLILYKLTAADKKKKKSGPVLQGFSLDMHATSFLQWWINQQGQPGGSFNKRLREVSKTPILSYHNHRSSGEHEWSLQPQIFTASSEVLWDTRAVVFHGAILIGSALHSRKGTQGFFFNSVCLFFYAVGLCK